MKKALKIYISVDMEGMAGITSPSQERDEVPSFRRALHNQVRWIIEGIHASSRNDEIGEITISDSHGSGTNLSYDELCQMDERISLVSGSPRRQYMMSCLDETYDVVFLAGYHAGPGEDFANMDHSFYGRVVSSLTVMSILLLWKEGKLDLDDNIKKYLDEYINIETPITIRQMMNNVSGLRDQWELLFLRGIKINDQIDMDDINTTISLQKSLNFEPQRCIPDSTSG